MSFDKVASEIPFKIVVAKFSKTQLQVAPLNSSGFDSSDNSEQKPAVLHEDGRLIVFACIL